ncbi:MAG TPA: hypothetical protein PKA06_06540 [Gemmatales bacterium]|nr:hypothetical protein [Gemmatales bacterium]
MLYDLTLPKYYKATADDYTELENLRNTGYDESLFLVVYFIQMPNHNYTDCELPSNDRFKMIKTPGIINQYQKLKNIFLCRLSGPKQTYRIAKIYSGLTTSKT